MSVLLLNERELRRCVSMTHEAVETVALGYTRLSEGRVSMPPVVRVDIPAHRGEVDIKTAYIEGLDQFAIKVASGLFDIVVTTTPTREPYLRAEWLHPGLHLTAVGADGDHKQELDADCFARAHRIACDSRRQCLRIGELHHAAEAGVFRSDGDIVELGELTGGLRQGRESDDEITICDLTGVGVQDTTIAVAAFRAARELRLGTPFEV